MQSEVYFNIQLISITWSLFTEQIKYLTSVFLIAAFRVHISYDLQVDLWGLVTLR